MNEKMKLILDCFHRYNAPGMAFLVFGLDPQVVYDVLVVAPGFTPYRLGVDAIASVSTLNEGSYTGGYLVETDGRKIAWIKMGSSDSNLIDHVAICAELQFKKMVFIGAVGALKPGFELGEICTPSYSIAGGMATGWLNESIRDYVPYEKVYPDEGFITKVISLGQELRIPIRKTSVFCTPSIALEYLHLDEIRSFDTDLIEMETAAFYRMAALLEVPSVALLVISDNSATGKALIGRTDEEQARYDHGRKVLIPRMITAIAGMP